MLVLLSFALVLLATVLLVLGLLNDDGLTLIYISIASSVAAAIVLMVALKLNKPRHERTSTGPAPLPDLEPAPEPERELAPVGATTIAPAAAVGGATGAIEAAPRSEDGPEPPSEWHAADQDEWAVVDSWAEGDEVEFPIADYDTLTVGQILPLLPQLYADEIDVVEEREKLTKARPQVLAQLAELREATAEPASVDPLASYTEPGVVAATAASTADAASGRAELAAGAGWDDDEDWFPIEDYESLSAAQIKPLLPELDEEELAQVRAREMALGRRRSLLDEIDRRMGAGDPAAEVAAAEPASAPVKATPARKAAPAAKAAPAKAAPAKRTSTPKAPAKKTAKTATKKAGAPASKRSAAPSTTKAAAKGSTAKKAVAKKAVAKKAAAKGTAAKTATAKKATAKKTATPAKKTAKKAPKG